MPRFALAALAVAVACIVTTFAQPAPASKIAYWNTPRRGANLFNSVERAERLQAAHAAGIEFVRLAPSKWLNGRPATQLGDFLIGPRDAYTGVNANDLRALRAVLDAADAAGEKVVLTMLSLPGARWSQHNNGVEERKIWTSFAEQDRAIACWRDLAAALRDHPAIVGYNILNEPSPERVAPALPDWYTGDYAAWYARVRGTPADLNLFYRKAVAAIRQVDPQTPIVLDSGFFATPWAFKVLEPVDDSRVLYSFHMYEPYTFTNHRNQGKFRYPGAVPTGEGDTPVAVNWDRPQMASFLKPVADWQERNHVPANRILAGEFGVTRTNPGAVQYMTDVIATLESRGWHWAFYGYREDGWDKMDYELGTTKPPAGYWQAVEQNVPPDPAVVYKPNALWNVISRALRRPAAAR